MLAGRALDEVFTHYSDPSRFYHTLDHIRVVLETVESLALTVRNLNAVKLAAWLHDVIYDSKASDNEERSAAFAERVCQELAIPEGRHVASLILMTKTHDAGDDPDAKVLLDADLAVLGASEPVYRDYAQQIRQEYSWVAEPDYRSGRQKILMTFLARPKIYHLLAHLEGPARRNISAEVARLAIV
jgi:predicted metal-dependent HD superfamily phosphohydrolase